MCRCAARKRLVDQALDVWCGRTARRDGVEGYEHRFLRNDVERPRPIDWLVSVGAVRKFWMLVLGGKKMRRAFWRERILGHLFCSRTPDIGDLREEGVALHSFGESDQTPALDA